MDKDLIAQQEAANDGQTIYLYYDDMVGMYVAYGLSAYYADMVTDPIISFSEAIGKPAALLGKQQVLYLRQGLTKEEHVQKRITSSGCDRKLAEPATSVGRRK